MLCNSLIVTSEEAEICYSFNSILFLSPFCAFFDVRFIIFIYMIFTVEVGVRYNYFIFIFSSKMSAPNANEPVTSLLIIDGFTFGKMKDFTNLFIQECSCSVIHL